MAEAGGSRRLLSWLVGRYCTVLYVLRCKDWRNKSSWGGVEQYCNNLVAGLDGLGWDGMDR